MLGGALAARELFGGLRGTYQRGEPVQVVQRSAQLGGVRTVAGRLGAQACFWQPLEHPIQHAVQQALITELHLGQLSPALGIQLGPRQRAPPLVRAPEQGL